jgi:hypothetical protein
MYIWSYTLDEIEVQSETTILQGYRDAHCLFLEAPVDGSADYADPQKKYLLSQRRQDFRLCLAIHAPRRGVIEVGIQSDYVCSQ